MQGSLLFRRLLHPISNLLHCLHLRSKAFWKALLSDRQIQGHNLKVGLLPLSLLLQIMLVVGPILEVTGLCDAGCLLQLQ